MAVNANATQLVFDYVSMTYNSVLSFTHTC